MPTDLKSLQSKWYDKLKALGFKDIEDTSSPNEYLKRWDSSYFFHRNSPESFEEKQTYYRLASQFLHQYSFKSSLEEQIWIYHIDGISHLRMARLFKQNKIKCSKTSIHLTITRLRNKMRQNDWQTKDEESSKELKELEQIFFQKRSYLLPFLRSKK